MAPTNACGAVIANLRLHRAALLLATMLKDDLMGALVAHHTALMLVYNNQGKLNKQDLEEVGRGSGDGLGWA